MLGVVDGIAGLGRSRPPQPGSYRRFRASCELRKVGKPALSSLDGFKSVEGRRTWPDLVKIETRIRETDPPLGCASRRLY